MEVHWSRCLLGSEEFGQGELVCDLLENVLGQNQTEVCCLETMGEISGESRQSEALRSSLRIKNQATRPPLWITTAAFRRGVRVFVIKYAT